MLQDVHRILGEFAANTRLQPRKDPPIRYLWTDAFAVTQFWHMYAYTGKKEYVHWMPNMLLLCSWPNYHCDN